MKKILPKIINNDQTGFLKNRFIGENIRLINSIIDFTNTKQIPGLLLFIDFEKVFDSIEWSFIEKTLNHFNFGTSLVAWIKLFYTNVSSCIQNNGWSSEFFSLSRVVRQGCPLSPYLFILWAEVLGNAVRKDKEVRGIKIGTTECKLSQYADDTTMILDGSEHSFCRTLLLLDNFAYISGLKVNYEKTEGLGIGSCTNSNKVIPSNNPISWAESKIYALGVWFSTLRDNDIDINFTDKIEKILRSWSGRKLTLLGKIAVLKSLAVSQIVYVLSSLVTPRHVVNEVNSLLYQFLWDGKNDQIKRTEMINNYNNGGLRMIDFQSFNQALKMKWVKGYLEDDNQGKWKLFFDYHLEKYGGKLVFSGNLRRQDVPLLNLSDPFLIAIIEYWSTLNYWDEGSHFSSSQICTTL